MQRQTKTSTLHGSRRMHRPWWSIPLLLLTLLLACKTGEESPPAATLTKMEKVRQDTVPKTEQTGSRITRPSKEERARLQAIQDSINNLSVEQRFTYDYAVQDGWVQAKGEHPERTIYETPTMAFRRDTVGNQIVYNNYRIIDFKDPETGKVTHTLDLDTHEPVTGKAQFKNILEVDGRRSYSIEGLNKEDLKPYTCESQYRNLPDDIGIPEMFAYTHAKILDNDKLMLREGLEYGGYDMEIWAGDFGCLIIKYLDHTGKTTFQRKMKGFYGMTYDMHKGKYLVSAYTQPMRSDTTCFEIFNTEDNQEVFDTCFWNWTMEGGGGIDELVLLEYGWKKAMFRDKNDVDKRLIIYFKIEPELKIYSTVFSSNSSPPDLFKSNTEAGGWLWQWIFKTEAELIDYFNNNFQQIK